MKSDYAVVNDSLLREADQLVRKFSRLEALMRIEFEHMEAELREHVKKLHQAQLERNLT